jgi:hypothetical protein
VITCLPTYFQYSSPSSVHIRCSTAVAWVVALLLPPLVVVTITFFLFLHFGNTIEYALFVRWRYGIETIKGIAHGLAKRGRFDRTQSAHGILVQENITTNGHFNLGSCIVRLRRQNIGDDGVVRKKKSEENEWRESVSWKIRALVLKLTRGARITYVPLTRSTAGFIFLNSSSLSKS